MIPSLGRLRKRLFGISPEETTLSRRGFLVSAPAAQNRLETIGQTFVHGYHSALLDPTPQGIAARLDVVEAERRGFAFEGAGMGLALLDQLLPWKQDRFQTFLNGPGAPHAYMMHVGCGWALARLHRRVERPLRRLDSLLGWLALDGYGFHEGYFHWRRFIDQRIILPRLTGYALRAFDQGLGRSLWFMNGADADRISLTIATFSVARRADLWSGIGLACTYAGAGTIDHTTIELLRTAAGPYLPHLAQGAAFAAKARQRAGNPASHTDLACSILCDMSANGAAALTDTALLNLPSDTEDPTYEVWRRRIQVHFARSLHSHEREAS